MRRIVLPSFVLSLSAVLLAYAARAEPTVGDRAAAEQILAEVGRSGPESSKTVARPVDEASRALRRAKAARDAGDVLHVAHFEGLAREWAEVARDLVRAAKTEAEATDLEQKASKASLQSERARALLEETIARKGEATAQLERIGAGEPSRLINPARRPAEPRPISPSRPSASTRTAAAASERSASLDRGAAASSEGGTSAAEHGAAPERGTASAAERGSPSTRGRENGPEVVQARTERGAGEPVEAGRAQQKPTDATNKTEPAKVQR